MKYKVRINPVAIADVHEIIANITEDNPQAAARLGNKIYSKIEMLSDFPEMGASLSSKINIRTDYRLVNRILLDRYNLSIEFEFA